jgi:hypothetical protein
MAVSLAVAVVQPTWELHRTLVLGISVQQLPVLHLLQQEPAMIQQLQVVLS